MTYILLTDKLWHDVLFERLSRRPKENWIRLKRKEEFSLSKLQEINPKKIFIPHWSCIIPKEVYEAYECVVFHMTDLPFGRGGSPLQNLISQGYDETKISALQVEKGIDTGPIYLKKSLNLNGDAEEIFMRSSNIIYSMILEIIDNDLIPQPQKGDITTFKRRKPEESDIVDLNDLNQLYDFIRMLDADGYPKAFLETKSFRLEFSRASLKSNSIISDVRITKK